MRALQLMDLPLQEIKKVLEYGELEKIIDFLVQAEKKADEKIMSLQYSKTKIQLAREDYERKLQRQKIHLVHLSKIFQSVLSCCLIP